MVTSWGLGRGGGSSSPALLACPQPQTLLRSSTYQPRPPIPFSNLSTFTLETLQVPKDFLAEACRLVLVTGESAHLSSLCPSSPQGRTGHHYSGSRVKRCL